MNVLGDGRIRFVIGADTVTASDIRSPSSLPEGRLIHVAATLDDATGLQRIYFDGEIVAETTTSIRPPAALDPTENPGVGIGNTQGDKYHEAFPGIIAEVRISNVALEPDQFLFTGWPGDLDGDGFVGNNDLDTVLVDWGHSPPILPNSDPSGDGSVGQDDLDIVLGDWGRGVPPASVPEPATLGMFALCGLAMLRRKPTSR